jgi:hypothetical protein
MDDNSAGARKAKRRTIADINAGIAGLAKTTPATEADAHELAAQEQGAGGPSSGRQSEALQQVLILPIKRVGIIIFHNATASRAGTEKDPRSGWVGAT